MRTYTLAKNLPRDSLASGHRSKADQLLALVKSSHHIAQMRFGIPAVMLGKRVVDPPWPAQFLESGQEQMLLGGQLFELFDQLSAKPELIMPAIVAREGAARTKPPGAEELK